MKIHRILKIINVFINKIIFKIFGPLAGGLSLGACGTGAVARSMYTKVSYNRD